ncbi:MAG TPA: winged helix-turn-helix domain-containing protein [Vicinamibacterales bacterium]|jgi:DNA-binding winged helix-turn-helix (wHTH) protein|nr:winged helix-turn-helix domain-containing protein [Vicinamibacterales bacterium]
MPDPSARRAEARRYRFGEFVVSPRRRQLLRNGTPVPLIPRYFDLLLLLIDRRDEAVDRREIFDRVWSDVVVSDGALTQAVRTLRRTLEDDSREPRYIRTVSRHGYRFVFSAVDIEPDETAVPPAEVRLEDPQVRLKPDAASSTPDELIERLVAGTDAVNGDEDRRDAAEQLHALGTEEVLRRLDHQPGPAQARARAILRDTRWDVPNAGDVPLLGAPSPASAIAALIRLRIRRAAGAAANRVLAAAAGGAVAGALAGIVGAVILLLGPGSRATAAIFPALAAIGLTAGAVGSAGIGAGLAAAEVLARRHRRLGLVVLGAIAGLVTTVIVRALLQSILTAVLGHGLAALGGAFEGLVIGGAAGAGYAVGVPLPPGGGMASPHGRARVRAALFTALACGVTGGVLGAAGWQMISVSLDRAAEIYEASQVGLEPLARALGEGDLRPVTRAVAGSLEGFFFGAGLGTGLTHRPGRRSR